MRKYGYMILHTDKTIKPATSSEFWTTAGHAYMEAEKRIAETGNAGVIIIIDNRSDETREFLKSKGLPTEWLDRGVPNGIG